MKEWRFLLTSFLLFVGSYSANLASLAADPTNSVSTNLPSTNIVHVGNAVTNGTNAPSAQPERTDLVSAHHEQTAFEHLWACIFAAIYILAGTLAIVWFIKRELDLALWLKSREHHDEMRDVRLFNLFILPALHVSVSAVLLYRCFPAIATVLIWAVAWFSLGTLLGVIFGVPKYAARSDLSASASSNAQTATPSAHPIQTHKQSLPYSPNNNLVEVSDWLTKIIVGLGLVHLKQLDDYLIRAANPLRSCLGEDCYLAFGIGLILGFGSLGFLFGWVFTKLFLSGAISRADAASERLNELAEKTKQSISEKVDQLPQAAPDVSKRTADAPSDWVSECLRAAELYEKDQFSDYRKRVAHKDNYANQIAAVLIKASVPINTVIEQLIPFQKTPQNTDGLIAGIASYVLARPTEDALDSLTRVARLANRLHTKYRLIMAFQELLRRGIANEQQLNSLRRLLVGWSDQADASLKGAISALEDLIQRLEAA